MILVDLAIRSVDLSDHYSDAWILPRAFQQVAHFRPHPSRFSFHMLSGEVPLQAALFVASGIFAVLLVLGWRTRLSLLVSFVLMISVQNRNAEIETGGDYLLRLICFWCLFLPLGARFSLDHRAGRGTPDLEETPGRCWFTNAATVALILQMVMVYVFSGLHKTHPIWRVHDTAIHYALHIDAYDTSLGELLRQFPVITTALTRITLQFELYAIFALVACGMLSLIPGLDDFWEYQGPTRTVTVFVFIGFHLGLASSLSLGTFAWFSAVIWIGFLPTWAWDTFSRWHLKRVKLERKRARLFKEKGRRPKKPTPPWMQHLLRTLTRIEALSQSFETPRTKKTPRPWAPPLLRKSLSFLEQAFVVVILGYVFLWNLSTLHPRQYAPLLQGRVAPWPDARPLIDTLRLDQHWGLFAPYPRTSDGYYVVLGKTAGGQELDFLRPDHRVTWEKPDDVSGSYKTFRWRKYFRNIRRRSSSQNLSLYTDYLCSNYNAEHSGNDKIESISIYFMRRVTSRKGGHEPTKKERLYVRGCEFKTPEPRVRRPRPGSPR